MPLSRSDILTLARRFNAGLRKQLSRVALATIEFIRRYATGNIFNRPPWVETHG
jgi:hypothetical protein